MRNSEFTFPWVNLLHYKCHKTNLEWVGSYMQPPINIKNKKKTRNSINDDYKHSQQATIVVFNQNEIGKKSQRILHFL